MKRRPIKADSGGLARRLVEAVITDISFEGRIAKNRRWFRQEGFAELRNFVLKNWW